ncbi:MAG TPA: hypothetical protein PLZ51_29635, partial [Aggregatilineales bacterium]|nr:hypothetical protein [Aggregatilineales bacterium]
PRALGDLIETLEKAKAVAVEESTQPMNSHDELDDTSKTDAITTDTIKSDSVQTTPIPPTHPDEASTK